MCELILFCLANLYITGELNGNPGYDMPRNEGYWCMNHQCQGPRARLKVGMAAELGDWEIRYGFLHESFPMEPHDKGVNVPYLELTWRPFK